MKLLILAANGQIARIVEQRVLTEDAFKDVQLTLGLRNSQRLAQLADNPRVRLVDVDLTSAKDVADAMVDQDIVFVAVVDHGSDNAMTKNVVSAARTNGTRVIATNILGIYNEVPGEFGRWNLEMVKSGLQAAVAADELLANSGLDFTTLRLPWLNDRDDVKYTITSSDEPFVGVSGSRQSVADVVLRIVADPTFAINDSIGLADPDTEDLARPVY
jgi:uncharacterized protein YbjT (DUF2867 family)